VSSDQLGSLLPTKPTTQVTTEQWWRQ